MAAELIETGYYKNTPHYNTQEWCQSALHFKEFGRYTNYPPNSHPSSRYYKFWEEEARRSVYGYNIGRDWIPGYFYFYLNYSPIYRAIERDAGGERIAMDFSKLAEQEQADRVFSFADFWDGDYTYFHYLDDAEKSGTHGAVIKSRRRGYSFKGGGMCNRNYYLIPGSKSYVMADEKEYLISDGLLTKAWDMMDHIESHTPWGKRRQRHDSIMHKRSSYYEDRAGLKIEKGFKSEIIGITLKNNYNKARGKAGKLIIYEEAGKNPNLLKAWNISLKSMQQGRLTFGLQIAFGTGGTEDVDFMGLEQLFYEGGAHSVYMVPNIWDDVSNGRCGYFSSIEKNLEGTMDKDGNTDPDLAYKLTEASRDKVRKNTKNPETITRFIAEEPRKPQEAIMRIGGTIFPINDLKDHLNTLRADPEKYQEKEWLGKLGIDKDSQKIIWKPDPDVRPIRIFPQTDKRNIEGAIVIYEHPVPGADGEIPYNVYIAGNDTYDHDESTTDSLGSTFILNRITDRIVAEYTGRPQTANEYYENVRRLLLYYNARCNYENNWKGLFTYFNNRNSAYLLCDTPKIVHDKIFDKSLLNRGAGTPGTTPIQKWGRELILIWLTTPVSPGSEILNLHKIRSIPLLQELIYWHKDGNFDRVDALQMLMILKEDVMNLGMEDESRQDSLPEFFSRMEMFKEKRKIEHDPFENILKAQKLKRRQLQNN